MKRCVSVNDPNRPDCKSCERPMMRSRGKTRAGNQRYECRGCGAICTAKTADNVKPKPLPKGKVVGSGSRFVVTTAMNNTPVNKSAFQSLLVYCEHNDAELIIIPCRYKWKKPHHKAKYQEWWADEVKPYIIDSKVRLGPSLYARGDIQISPTAVNPSSGMAPLVGNTWSIFGHGQQSMVAVATPITELPNRFYTPGAITQKQYSPTKTGAKAAFHHVTGALVVEVSGKDRFIRQVNICPKGFTDLDKDYTPSGVKPAKRAASLVLGDEHVRFIRQDVVDATFRGPDSIVGVCKPKNLVRHDVLDMYAGSHHHEKSYRTMFAKSQGLNSCVRTELDQAVEHLRDTTPPGTRSVVVCDSNHHDHLEQWLSRTNPMEDHVNADVHCELQMLLRDAVRRGDRSGLFQLYAASRGLKKGIKWVTGDRPYMIGGVDHSQHGHRGVNGARGSARGIANTTHKATIGHSHTAGVHLSVFQTGKSCGTLEYEGGLGTHTNSHVLQYANGKRTIIDIFDGRWRA